MKALHRGKAFFVIFVVILATRKNEAMLVHFNDDDELSRPSSSSSKKRLSSNVYYVVVAGEKTRHRAVDEEANSVELRRHPSRQAKTVVWVSYLVTAACGATCK